jgi:hypothetical protein
VIGRTYYVIENEETGNYCLQTAISDRTFEEDELAVGDILMNINTAMDGIEINIPMLNYIVDKNSNYTTFRSVYDSQTIENLLDGFILGVHVNNVPAVNEYNHALIETHVHRVIFKDTAGPVIPKDKANYFFCNLAGTEGFAEIS